MNISAATRRRLIDAAMAAERDPSADLTVSDLAEYAGMSDKHFQRAFRKVMCESPKKYLRRIRLQASAYLLKWSEMSVLDIALHAGFESHAGFTKAFTKAYGLSPTDFRDTHEVTPYLRVKSNPAHTPVQLEDLETSRLIVRIEQTPPFRVAAMRHIGPVEQTANIWPKMVAWAKRNQLFSPNSIFLGIHNDYWDENAKDKYRYDAAIVIPDNFTPCDDVNTFTIAGGEVAMTEFSGSLSEADDAWRRFVDQWLPISGYKVRTGFAYDRYPFDVIQAGPLRRILQTLTGIKATLCLPVLRSDY